MARSTSPPRPTSTGDYDLVEVFPFFNWMVAEVDFARFKATGATFVVDAGGPVPEDQDGPCLARDKLTRSRSQRDGGRTDPHRDWARC